MIQQILRHVHHAIQLAKLAMVQLLMIAILAPTTMLSKRIIQVKDHVLVLLVSMILIPQMFLVVAVLLIVILAQIQLHVLFVRKIILYTS